MRTHVQIIESAGGAHSLALLINTELAGDPEVIRKRVWAWQKSASIPGEYWALLARKEVASVDELAAAAEQRKLVEPGGASACGEGPP